MVQNDFTRQLNIFDPSQSQIPLIIVGAGSIGSFAAFFLAKMGIKYISVIDFDIVENHNIPNQFYPSEDLFGLKAYNLARRVQDLTGTSITPFSCHFKDFPVHREHGILVSAVDSMSVRKEIIEVAEKYPYQYPVVIDLRIGREDVTLYSFVNNPANRQCYMDKFWLPDKEIPDLGCSERNVIYTAIGASYLLTYEVKRTMLLAKNNPTLIGVNFFRFKHLIPDCLSTFDVLSQKEVEDECITI